MIYVVYVLLGLGLFFSLAGVLGLIRMPDVLSRMQSSTNISTLGILGVIAGGIVYSIFALKDPAMTIKLAVLGGFYILTAPITGHALGKAAYASRAVKPEELAVDQLKEDLEDAHD